MKALAILALIVIAACAQTPTGNVVQEGQQVIAYASGPNYVFEPSTVKAGEPVTLLFDAARLPGCSRTVVVPEYGVRKTITAEDNKVTFTPSAGEIRVQCSMNMYSGVLVAE